MRSISRPLPLFPPQQVSVSDSPPPWLTGPWQRQLIRLGKAATHFLPRFGRRASLPSFAYPACPVHLPVLVAPPPPTSPSLPHRLPPMILSRICLLLLLYFSVKPLALLSPLVCLSDKADSNWKLSVFTIPQWLPGCRHTSALKQRHTHTHTSHLLFLLSCLVLVQLKEDLIHLSCRSCSAR